MNCSSRICLVLAGWMVSAGVLRAGERAAADATALPPHERWTTSRVVGFPDPPPPYVVERVYPNLPLTRPIGMGRFPADDLLWIITHTADSGYPGNIQLFHDRPDVDATEMLIERPEILYGLAFHPDFATNRFVFLGCNGETEAFEGKASRVLRFTVTAEPPYRCEPESETVIIEWKSDGHNGIDLAFGSDGMLYVSAGDGTSDSDPDLAGQDLTTLTGSLLRIDVDHPDDGKPYSVPADNPFVDLPDVRPEIWAYGLRNPWKVTYDHASNQLWVGNNGQDLWETAYLIQKGGNYGWSVMEGSHPFQVERPHGPTPLLLPTVEHHHSEARSLTGGVVYRGENMPKLLGAYVYGDYSTGNIWGALHEGNQLVWNEKLARSTLQITGFGINRRDELLVIDHGGGLYRLAQRGPQADETTEFPQLLSETGIFSNVASRETQPGLIPYSVNSPLWSDGAQKERFLGLPGDERITFNDKGTWDFPNGTVLVKTFSLPIEEQDAVSVQPVETRLLTRQDGEWFGYSYAWNDELTDAELVPAAGRDRDFQVRHDEALGSERQVWHYPSRAECMVCHSRAAKFVLGLGTPQMNRDHAYGEGASVNQLEAFEHWRLFHKVEKPIQKDESVGDEAGQDEVDRQEASVEGGKSEDVRLEGIALHKPVDTMPRLADPLDDQLPLESRVRAYLDANCASCHVAAGGGNSLMQLDAPTALDKMRILDVVPQHDQLGITDARLVAPGDPSRSVLLERVSRRERGQMPPLGTNRVDEQGVALIREWIAGLPAEGP